MTTKLDHFMEQGPYVDYPFEDVMFRWDASAETLLAKHYGADEEYAIGWASNLLNEMLVSKAGLRLSKEEYEQGKGRTQTNIKPSTRRRRRELFPFDQALYLNTTLSCEAYALAVRLDIRFRSKASVVDWLTSDTQPETSVQISESMDVHPAAVGQIDPDLELFWDERGDMVGDPATYELQVGQLVKSISHQEVTGGLFVANSTRAVWWTNADGVTITSDPAVLSSMPGQQIVPALQAAEVEYRNA